MQRRLLFKSSAVGISMVLILYVMGVFGLVLIHTTNLSNHLQENLLAFAYIDHKVPPSAVDSLAVQIESNDMVRSVHAQTSAEVASEYELIFEEDVTTVLGYNPLPHVIEFKLAHTQNTEEAQALVEWVEGLNHVALVDFQADLLQRIQALSTLVGRVLLFVMLALLLIVLLLINSAIRLDIYAKRFLIKSMQLVGAKEGFILKPILSRYVYLTLIAAVISCVAVLLSNSAIVNWLNSAYLGLSSVLQIDIQTYSILFVVVLVIGLSVVLPSSYFATRRYINSKIDELY